MSKQTLEKILIAAVEEALEDKGNGRIVRPSHHVSEIRKNLHMTQKQFSEQYNINLETLKNWEQNKRFPDTTSLAYLYCIEKKPKLIKEILHTDH